MRIVNLPAGGEHPAPPIIVEGGFVGVHCEHVLRMFDIRMPEARLALELPGIVAAIAARSAVLVLDTQGVLTRWELRGERWVPGVQFRVPSFEPEPSLAASPSGHAAFIDGKHGLLIDLEGGRIVSELDSSLGTARPHFEQLPDGREVLFVAAPSYMSVRMLDAIRGDRLAGHENDGADEFCHVAFRLALGGLRLVTFGCIWGSFYEVKIYDATPWVTTTTATSVLRGFPLRTVRTIEPIAANTLLAAHTDHATSDITSACLEDREELLPDEDGEPLEGLRALRAGEPELAAQLDRVRSDDPSLLIVRRIDPSTGCTVSSSVHPIPRVDERHVHYASDHRVVVAGPRLLVCNANDDRIDDFGELRLTPETRTAVTPDGRSLLVTRR